MRRRKKNTSSAPREASPHKGRKQDSSSPGRLTRAEYEFQCKLRNPDFQKDLVRFFRDFPVLYRLSSDPFTTFGRYEPKARETWSKFLAKNRASLQEVEKGQNEVVLKFAPKDVRQAVRLSQFENEIRDMQWRLMIEANVHFGAEPNRFLERIDTYSWFLRLPELANPDYFSRIKRRASEYAEREHQFVDKWGFFPHSRNESTDEITTVGHPSIRRPPAPETTPTRGVYSWLGQLVGPHGLRCADPEFDPALSGYREDESFSVR